MTDTFDPPASEDSVPIDAEFEPARKSATPKQSRRALHWLVTLLVAALALLAIAVSALDISLFQKTDTTQDTITALQSDMAELTTQLDNANAERARLANQLRSLQTETTAQGQGTDALSARTDAAFRSLGNIEDKLDELEQAITALERPASPGPDGPLVQAPDPLVLERLDALEAALSQSGPDRPPVGEADPALMADISALRLEIEALKTTLAETPEDVAPEPAPQEPDWVEAALALSAIETASRNGQPFVAAFEQMANALPGNRALPPLAPVATGGAPTLFALKGDFPNLKRRALDAEAKTKGGSAGWMRAIFGDGITVQRDGETGAGAALQTAETALETGDLASAIAAIESLGPDVQSIFTDWLNNARNRQTLDTSLNTLRLTLLAKERP